MQPKIKQLSKYVVIQFKIKNFGFLPDWATKLLIVKVEVKNMFNDIY